MPRRSKSDNVRKICGCAKWKACAHPWYLDYQRDNVRYRDNLDQLTGRHAADFTAAKDEARRAIVAKLEGRDPRDLQPSDDPTVAQVMEDYGKRQDAGPREAEQVTPITTTVVMGKAFGTWRLSEVTSDVLEAFQAERPLVAGNRNLAMLRAMCRWAVRKGLLAQTPFRVGNVTVVSLRSEAARTRRLHPGEAERLIEDAARLRDLIIAALETGCRMGELLSLQWSQVRFTPRAELFLPAQKTKAKRDRRIPISSVLRPVLEARRCDPAGELVGAGGYVFGDEVGRRSESLRSAVRACGLAWRRLCRRLLIDDLHFHDLRREAGSRWMDAGVSLGTIQRWLGHANIAQTSTYLGASMGGDEQDMRAYEERIGRLTLIDVLGGSTRQSDTSTDRPTVEKTEENLIGPEPTGTVH